MRLDHFYKPIFISIFYFSFIEKIILSSENRLLNNTFAPSPERAEFFDPAAQFGKMTFSWITIRENGVRDY